MKATIGGVDLFIMAYAWSQKGISYFVSTCGTTVRHSTDYQSKFPDGFGNTDARSYPRPSIAHMVYEFLPLIDEHNKARQNLLALELKWLTKCCWFRLRTTFIGMAVVDVQRWDRNRRRHLPLYPTPPDEVGEYEEDPTGSIRVYADLIAKKLLDPLWTYRPGTQPSARRGVHTDPGYVHPVVRYEKEGKVKNDKGKAYQRYCYVCRLHGEINNTQWACRECNMPLCNRTPRRNEEWACYNFHKNSEDVNDGCCGEHRSSFVVPEENLQYRQLSKKRARVSRKDGRERRVDRRPKQQEKVAVQEEQDEPEEEEEGVAVGNTGLRRSARLWAV
jgi:hypothetical protein